MSGGKHEKQMGLILAFMKHHHSWLVAASLLLFITGETLAWKAEGHAAVGVLAVEQVRPETRAALEELLGSVEADFIAQSCNWPDEYDQTMAGAWTEPLHYVNLPPGADSLSYARDCPDRRCLPAAIVDYARELGDRALSRNARQQAFAFVCHFTADLHQPLHVAHADDRGGSRITVEYRGERLDLHVLWDQRLIDHRVPAWQELVDLLSERPNQNSYPRWQPGEVEAWTNETYTLMKQFAYPQQHEVDEAWAERAWQVIQNQLDTAAGRLAAILDAILDTR
jgi:hypothetical protein